MVELLGRHGAWEVFWGATERLGGFGIRVQGLGLELQGFTGLKVQGSRPSRFQMV